MFMEKENVTQGIEKVKFVLQKRSAMMILELILETNFKDFTMQNKHTVNGRLKMFPMSNGTNAMIDGMSDTMKKIVVISLWKLTRL